jgi:transposase
MPFVSSKLEISEEDKRELQVLSRSTRAEHRLVFRAKIILLLSQGKSYSEIKIELSTNHQAIAKWKKRFQEHGISGLSDLSGRGREKKYTKYDEARVTNLACSKPDDGYSTWSQDRIAKELKMSQSTVCIFQSNPTTYSSENLPLFLAQNLSLFQLIFNLQN